MEDEILMKEIINPLININSDLYEVTLDNFINNEIIKDIPILNTVTNLFHLSTNIQNAIFLKKLYIFIINLPNTTEEEKIYFLKRYKKDESKFTEKIFEILDKLDDSNKCKYESKIFEKYFHNKISYKEFLKYSYSLQKISITELEEGYEIKQKNNRDSEGNLRLPNYIGSLFLSIGMADVIPLIGACTYSLNANGNIFLSCIFE